MARTKVIAIKHFKGCINFEAVRVKYKELAKQFHPDRPTGSTALFQELQAELEYIKEYAPAYPLGVTSFGSTYGGSYSMDDFLKNMYNGVDAFAEAARRAREEQKRQAEDLARRQRAARSQGPATDRADDPFFSGDAWANEPFFYNTGPKHTRRERVKQKLS